MYLKPDDAISDLRYEVTSEVPVLSEAEKLAGTAGRPRPVRAVPRPPGRLPAERHRPRRAGHERQGLAVGEGRRDRALPEHGRRLRLQRSGRAVALDQHARGIPLRATRGVLRAVRVGVRGDGAFDRPADARRGRLLVRHPAERRVAREEQGRARLAGGVLLRPRLGAARADAGRGANAPGGTGDPTQRPQESATASTPETTTPTTTAGATPPPSLGEPAGQPGRHLARSGRDRPRPGRASSVGQFFVALAFVAAALAILALIAHRRVDRARGAAHVASPPRRSIRAHACWARGRRPSTISPTRASDRNRRPLRSSSRCATPPRTARVTPAPR